jgi:hypothetical protein
VKTPLVLGHDLRLERARPVARLLDPHRPVLGVHRLRCHPVAGVADPARRRLSPLVAEMVGQLGLHRPLDQPLRQPAEQPLRAGDLLRRARAGEQLVDQLVRQLRRLERIAIRTGVDRRHPPIAELVRQGALPFQPARQSESTLPDRRTRPRSGPAYTDNRTDPVETVFLQRYYVCASSSMQAAASTSPAAPPTRMSAG